jgi:hypothetical protein
MSSTSAISIRVRNVSKPRDATRPATIGTPSDYAAYYCVRAHKQRVVMHSPPSG